MTISSCTPGCNDTSLAIINTAARILLALGVVAWALAIARSTAQTASSALVSDVGNVLTSLLAFGLDTPEGLRWACAGILVAILGNGEHRARSGR